MATTKKTAPKTKTVETVDAVAVEAPAKKAAKKTAPKATKTPKKVAAKATIVESVESTVSTVEKTAEKVQADVTKTVNENVEKAQELAKQAWFAGLGVVGRSADELQAGYAKASDELTKAGDELKSRYSRINESRDELVKTLINRGEKVQAEAEVLLQEGRTTVEERIETAKTRFTEMVDISARLQAASDKLESLSKDLKKSA